MIRIKDANNYKIVTAPGYNMVFSKLTGFMARWGNTLDEDPVVAPGPELADVELSTGSCSGNCPWCYKSNAHGNGKHMTLETYKQILDKLPKTICQIALGITDIGANPDFIPIMEHTRSKGIIPNFTLAGYGRTRELVERSSELCGAVAVSVYPHNIRLAYDTVRAFQLCGVEQTNIHLLYYQENSSFARSVLMDVANEIISPNAVVLLALKQKGRGTNLAPLGQEGFESLVDFAMQFEIPLGFDSCSAPKFEKWARKNGKEEQLIYCEPCEANLFSCYINVNGEFFPCSFVEGEEGWERGISVLECDDFIKDIWHHPRVEEWRQKLLANDRNCPVFEV